MLRSFKASNKPGETSTVTTFFKYLTWLYFSRSLHPALRFIPQRAGTLTTISLPEQIKNIRKNHLQVALLPAHSLNF
jgi:hypothetical protein